MKNLREVPVSERNNFTVRFRPELYKRIKAHARSQDKSMQLVVDDAVEVFMDWKESGKLETYPEFGKLTKDERLMLKAALDMYRNAKSDDREILSAILNWWRRKWQ